MERFLQRPIVYRIGFCVYFLSLLLFLCSFAILKLWIYDQEKKGSDNYEGHSVWNTRIRMCFEHSVTFEWNCEFFPLEYARAERVAAVTLMTFGMWFQLAACIIITRYNCFSSRPSYNFHSEVIAGCAESLSFTGLVIYAKFTSYGINLTYGPGFIVHAVAGFVSYVGLLMTGSCNDPPRRQRPLISRY